MPRVRPGSPKSAVAYLRLSPRKRDDDDRFLGLAAQRAQIEAWAAREGVQIASWHVDNRVGGGTPIDQRPGLLAAFAAVAACRSGFLLVAKRDRLARDVVIAALAERAIAKMGARLVAADGAGNGEGPSEEFMRNILDAAAAHERAVIRARTKAALAAKRAKGERTGGVPFGSRLAADGVHLEPHPPEQKVIAAARRLRARGLPLRAVVEELECLGLVGRTGNPLGLTQVAAILARTVAA